MISVSIRRILSFALLALTCVAEPCRAGSADFEFKGITYVSFQDKEYLSAGSEQSLNDLAATGANTAGLLVTWYVDAPTATEIFRRPLKTPDDAALLKAIRDLRARGLKIMLKPHVDVVDDSWRGLLRPADADAWFASYTAFITHYARIAQREGIELFCMGTEFRSLSGAQNRERWAAVIGAIRAEYTGPLTYSSLAIFIGDEYASVSFWDLLDLGGVNVYAQMTNTSQPTVDQLVAAWNKNRLGQDMVAEIRRFQAALNKPVILTEMGYQSADGTNINPTQNNFSLPYDPQEQADCYEAVFRVWTQEPWLKGIFWWGWAVQEAGPSDTSFTPRGKPAASVLREWYAQGAPPFVFTSTPAAFPDPAFAGQSVTLSGLAATPDGGTVSYIWDFGDGTSSAGATTTHVFAVAGTYIVKLSATDASGAALSSTFALVVLPVVAPDDFDGDGFPNAIEMAAGSSVSDPTSTPFGGDGPGATQPLRVNRARVHLNFRTASQDRLILSGHFNASTGRAASERTILDLGGVIRVFDTSTLRTRNEVWRLSETNGEGVRFLLRLKHTPLADQFSHAGLTANHPQRDARTLRMTLYFNGAVYATDVPGAWRSSSRSGTFRKGPECPE